jgi:hypothetical protein
MSLDTTVGGASANSFASVAEYKTYWGARLFNTVPLAQTDPNIEVGLKWGCLLLSACFRWTGAAVDDVQALPWPRSGMLSLTGFAIPTTVNPQQLKNAQCEWAGQLFSGDRTVDNAALKVIGSQTQLTAIKAGPVSLSFGGQTFSNIESFDAYVRSLGSDFDYLSKIVPDGVRVLLVPTWYIHASIKRKLVFGAF